MSKPTERVRSDQAPDPALDPDLHQADYYAAALAEALEGVPDILLERIATSSPFVARMCHTHAVLTDTLAHLGLHLDPSSSTPATLTDAASILTALKASPNGMTRSRIRRVIFHDRAPAGRVAMALGTLRWRGLARSEAVPTPGRTAERWFAVSPGLNT
jgi:hypothetical protein